MKTIQSQCCSIIGSQRWKSLSDVELARASLRSVPDDLLRRLSSIMETGFNKSLPGLNSAVGCLPADVCAKVFLLGKTKQIKNRSVSK